MSELRRAITLPLLVFYGLGTVIGAGIYVLVGKVAVRAEAFAPLAFLVAAFVAGLSALCFAELSARLPRAGGEASFVDHAFGRRWLSIVTGVVVMLTGVVSAATLAEGFAGYFRQLWEVPHWAIVVTVIVAMTALAIKGIAESVWIASIITLTEIGGLLFVLTMLGIDLPEAAERGRGLAAVRWWPTSLEAWAGIGTASFVAFYAFIGFEDMVNVAEEVRRPAWTMPRAIGLVMLVVTVLYLATAWLALAHSTPEALGEAEAPLVHLLSRQGAWAETLITAVGLVAVINGALVQIVKTSRVIYGMADQGLFFPVFARVWSRTRTPVLATLLVGAVIVGLALWLPLTTLAELTSFLILLVFLVIDVGLFVLKRREPTEGFAVPMALPLVGAGACLAMIAMRIAMLF